MLAGLPQAIEVPLPVSIGARATSPPDHMKSLTKRVRSAKPSVVS